MPLEPRLTSKILEGPTYSRCVETMDKVDLVVIPEGRPMGALCEAVLVVVWGEWLAGRDLVVE